MEDINNTMLRKYITKHYTICELKNVYPVSYKNRTGQDFKLMDNITGNVYNESHVVDILYRIFSVNRASISDTIKQLVIETVWRLQRQKLELHGQVNHIIVEYKYKNHE
jgi:hypothetical protein